MLQERLQERIRVEGELREEKNRLLNVIKEKEKELSKERSELTDRLQQHEQVIEVNIACVFFVQLGVETVKNSFPIQSQPFKLKSLSLRSPALSSPPHFPLSPSSESEHSKTLTFTSVIDNKANVVFS